MAVNGFFDDAARAATGLILEPTFLTSPVARKMRNALNIPVTEYRSDGMLEYVLGFYLFPANGTKEWIAQTLRPALLADGKLDKLFAVYSKPMNQNDLDSADLITSWQHTINWISNAYDLDASTLKQLNEKATAQYSAMQKVPDKIHISSHEDKPDWKSNPLTTVLSLCTVFIRSDWEIYWSGINGVIPMYIKKDIHDAFPGGLEPALLTLLLTMIRSGRWKMS